MSAWVGCFFVILPLSSLFFVVVCRVCVSSPALPFFFLLLWKKRRFYRVGDALKGIKGSGGFFLSFLFSFLLRQRWVFFSLSHFYVVRAFSCWVVAAFSRRDVIY